MTTVALDQLRSAYSDPLDAVRSRKAGEARIVGHFLNSVPVELIVAAGLHPVRLRGDPARRPVRADRYMEPYFDGELRAICEGAIEGDFAALDLLVIPRSSEIYLQLYYLLCELPRWEPDLRLPPVALFDLLQTPHYTTSCYVMGRMRDLAARLADIGGASVGADRLSRAIHTINRLRAALTRVSELWRGPVPRLSGADALRVIGAASVLQPEAAIALLDALADAPPAPLPGAGLRLMIKGSPQHDTRFTELVESCGARVVAHDHVAGDRIFERPVAEDGDPWEALVRHYQREIPGPRAYPQSREDARSLALAQEAAVDGVVIIHDEWDDTLGWEYPDQKRLFEANGIPLLFLKQQPWIDPPESAQRAAVSAFLNQIAGAGV